MRAGRVGINQEIIYIGEGVDQLFSTLQTQHHAGGGIGIRCHAIVCDNRGTQYVLPSRVASGWIDGMCVLFPILHVEVSIVTRSGNTTFTVQLHHLFHIIAHSFLIIFRLVDADAPTCTSRIDTTHRHLSTDFHHVILHPLPFQQASDHIASISLGNRRAV